ncbi:MAG: aminotransferase class I/II-fold pyridoxal phosphate-dependent enzyme [Peptococcaceae bacterium]|nr:aminotransferase class I/II-fold pyridoxal phosphate-dependent enzyme [Peptococcaceae bacterium]
MKDGEFLLLDQNSTPLFQSVKKHVLRNAIPLQIPGHKHGHGLEEYKDFVGENVLRMDLNQTRGIDLVWDPTAVITEAEMLLADVFQAGTAFFLINGTTSGVQAMIMSTCKPGDRIILPRNVHKSVFNALILSGAEPVYVQPEISSDLGIVVSVTPDNMEKAMADNPEAKAVLAINPSYYGVTANLAAITASAHQRHMPVLADEAHGTHMHFHEGFPASAMQAGADLSAVSLHKTGGSLTQSSALLLSKTSDIDPQYVKQVLSLAYTTSPSYVLLCSLDVARKQLATKGEGILDNLLEMLHWTRGEINKIDGLFAADKDYFARIGQFGFDDTKLLVNVRRIGLTGYEVEKQLALEHNILVELADMYNILAITGLGEQREYLAAFISALREIAGQARKNEIKKLDVVQFAPEIVMQPREAFYCAKRSLPLEQCAGEIAGEMIMVYPPGIPLVSMGEVITEDIIEYVKLLKQEQCTLQGTADPCVGNIMVLDV